MNRRAATTVAIGGACLVGLIAGARAGDLSPPPGPIQPTMRTLDEIYGKIGTLSTGGSGGRWTSATLPANSSTKVLAAAPGVVHSAILGPINGCDDFTLYDSATTDVAGKRVICRIQNPSLDEAHSRQYSLDVEFTQGLVYFSSGCRGPDVVIYKLD